MDGSRPDWGTDYEMLTEEASYKTEPLGAADNFALLMIRAWVRALTSEKGSAKLHDALNIWNVGFCRVGGITASRSLDQFISLLARKSSYKIQIGCPKCTAPNRDEQRILNCLSNYQHGKAKTGREYLGYWFEDEDMRFAEHHAIMFAAQLAQQNYMLNEPAEDNVTNKASRNRQYQLGDLENSMGYFASTTVH